MGRQEKSMLGCFGASAVAGIFHLYDSILRKNSSFRNSAKYVGLCFCRDYFCYLVETNHFEAKTGLRMERVMKFNH